MKNSGVNHRFWVTSKPRFLSFPLFSYNAYLFLTSLGVSENKHTCFFTRNNFKKAKKQNQVTAKLPQMTAKANFQARFRFTGWRVFSST